MAIGFLEINGGISRVQDYAQLKHNEDNKGVIQQGNLMANARKNEESKATEVNRSEDASNYLKRFDAKEKGSNEYYGDGGRKKDKKPSDKEKVVMKTQTSSFDIRI